VHQLVLISPDPQKRFQFDMHVDCPTLLKWGEVLAIGLYKTSSSRRFIPNLLSINKRAFKICSVYGFSVCMQVHS
jgi:hypothetical protein